MNAVSIMGATVSLECAILLMAAVLYLDFRRSARLRKLVLSMQATLRAAARPAVEEESHSKAA